MLDPLSFFGATSARGEPEVVTVSASGLNYSAFERVQVRASFKEAARSFRLEVAAELGASATNAIFAADTPVQIYIGGDLVIDGYVDSRDPQIDADSARINIGGRSKSSDLIDSSALHDTGWFENKTLLDIGNEIARGIAALFTSDQEMEQIPFYHLTQGKSVFDTVEELARQQGLTLVGMPDGNIKITKAGSQRHAGGLFEGKNIKIGSASHNSANRHSEYHVRGQRPIEHGAEALEIEAIARDAQIGRHRPIVIIEKQDTSKDRAKKRSENRRDRAAGNALRARITVVGFRDEGGTLWEPGHLVWTESPFLDIAQDMLIETVDFGQDSAGSLTALGLVDPRAFGGQGGKGNKSGESWSMDDSDAE